MSALNKIIFKTAVAGLVWTAAVFCYGLGIFAMCFPGAMASFYDTVGDKRLSAMYHERVYERNPTPDNLYMILNKSISFNDSNRIIKYFDKFYARKDYATRVAQIREDREKRATADGHTGTMWELASNEDSRLRLAYINAFIELDRLSDALNAYNKHGEFVHEIFHEELKTILGIDNETI